MLVPSPLNPVHIFQQEEDNMFIANRFGLDRGQFTRKLSSGVGISVYVQSSIIPNGVLVRCDTGVQEGLTVAFTLLTGDYYVGIFAGNFPLNRGFYIEVYNAAYIVVPAFTPVVYVPIVATTWIGSMFTLSKSCDLSTIKLSLSFGVAPTQITDLILLKLDPYDKTKVLNSASFTENWIGSVGILVKTVVVSGAPSITRGAKDSTYVILVRTRGTDNIGIGRTDAPYTTNILNNYLVSTTASLPTDGSGLIMNGRFGAAVEVNAVEAVFSEPIVFVNENSPTLSQTMRIKYRNIKLYQGIQPNTELMISIMIDLWMKSYPAEFEDIEIVPGEFTRLRNEVVNEVMFDTEYMPDYLHRKIQLLLGCDVVKINEVEYIQRQGYTFENQKNGYALSKGKVTLTERKSIVRNIK